ncbi:MAG: hypothetical protein IT249_02140 [Chitinophagaceae bacterium]|nr:hypothetical protein [Chitinophagaceae bacterium]
MSRFPIYIITFFIFLLTACSKEKSIEQKVQNPDDSTGNLAKGLLVRVVGKKDGASDSAIYTLSYDSDKRVKNMFTTSVGVIDEQYGESEMRYYRNSSGMIDRYVRVEKVRYNNTVQYDDSIVYKLYYNGTHYTYAIRVVPDLPDTPITDSIVYSYDGNDRISTVVIWRHDDDNDNKLFEFQKTVYAYDGNGNIKSMSITFKDDVNSNDPAQVLNFTYGDKSSPLNLGVDGSLEGFVSYGFSCPNNLLTMENPDVPEKVSYAYEYGGGTKPVKAVETDLLTNKKTNISYYYQ